MNAQKLGIFATFNQPPVAKDDFSMVLKVLRSRHASPLAIHSSNWVPVLSDLLATCMKIAQVFCIKKVFDSVLSSSANMPSSRISRQTQSTSAINLKISGCGK